MKKQIWIAAGIAGMLLSATPQSDARAEVGFHIRIGERHGPSFVLESWPNFIYLPDQGFYVSQEGPYDIIFFNNMYYINHGGYWYRSYRNRGPWVMIREDGLPPGIRGRRWDDIRHSREFEFRRRYPERFRDGRDDRRGPDRRDDFRGPDRRDDRRGPDQRDDRRGPDERGR